MPGLCCSQYLVDVMLIALFYDVTSWLVTSLSRCCVAVIDGDFSSNSKHYRHCKEQNDTEKEVPSVCVVIQTPWRASRIQSSTSHSRPIEIDCWFLWVDQWNRVNIDTWCQNNNVKVVQILHYFGNMEVMLLFCSYRRVVGENIYGRVGCQVY